MVYQEKLLEELSKLDFESLLDIGCGFMLPTLQGLRRIDSRIVLAGIELDLSPHSQEIARKNWIDLKQGNIEVLPYQDKSFDVVLSAAVLSMIDDVSKIISEMKRVAKKYIVLVEFQGVPKDYSTGARSSIRVMRDYPKEFNLYFEMIDIPKNLWPGEGWEGDAPGKIMIAKI